MTSIAGVDRAQAVLLPELLDDYVGPAHPVRFLDAFVAQLDLAALGFQRAVPADTGRPGYDPGDLLRLQQDIRAAHQHLNRAGHYAVIMGDEVRDYLRDV